MRLTKKKKKTQTQILLTAFSTVKRTQNFTAKAAAQRLAQVMASPLPVFGARSHQVPTDHSISLTQIKPISASFYLKPIAPDLSLFDYGLVWEWMSWVLCWVSILWMVWSRSGFVDVLVDDLIRWWCFAGCWVSILFLGFDLHVL